jgi:hypothetical protein
LPSFLVATAWNYDTIINLFVYLGVWVSTVKSEISVVKKLVFHDINSLICGQKVGLALGIIGCGKSWF